MTTDAALAPVKNGSMVRDRLMGYVLMAAIGAMSGLAVACLFHPPQEWQIVSTVIANLKDVILMILAGHFALSRNAS